MQQDQEKAEELEMASEAITGLGSERTETKGPVWNVAIDGIATRRWQANPFSTSTASAHCTYLKTIQSSPGLIHHHSYVRNLQWLHQRHHLITCCCGPIYLQINKKSIHKHQFRHEKQRDLRIKRGIWKETTLTWPVLVLASL